MDTWNFPATLGLEAAPVFFVTICDNVVPCFHLAGKSDPIARGMAEESH